MICKVQAISIWTVSCFLFFWLWALKKKEDGYYIESDFRWAAAYPQVQLLTLLQLKDQNTWWREGTTEVYYFHYKWSEAYELVQAANSSCTAPIMWQTSLSTTISNTLSVGLFKQREMFHHPLCSHCCCSIATSCFSPSTSPASTCRLRRGVTSICPSLPSFLCNHMGAWLSWSLDAKH